jgi:hypothetical protein
MAKQEYAVTAPEPIAAVAVGGSIRQAARAAAETFAPDEIEKHAQAIMDAWKARLEVHTKAYTRSMLARAAKPKQVLEAGHTTLPENPYTWFNLMCAGPYQWTPNFGFLPNKIVRYNEWAYMLACIWRNPEGVNWDPYSMSAAQIMSAYNFQVWFECVNLTTVSDGPDLGPFNFAPIGGGYLTLFQVLMPPGTFPTPASGRAHLYEINMTMDVTGPGSWIAGGPLSGFATWIFDPDLEQEIPAPVPPYWPSEPTSEKPAHWHYDIPVRFLVHA